MTYAYYWIEGDTAEGYIYATSRKRAEELFCQQYGEQKIHYVRRELP